MTAPASYLRELREQRTSRRLGVAKVLRETPNATNIELAKVFGVNRDTIAEDRKFLMSQVNNEAKTEFQQWRDEHIAELQELRTKLEDPGIRPAEKVALALAIIREDSKIKGTSAPSRSIVGHVSGPQLDALYLDIRQELIDLSDGDKQDALLLMREFAKSRKKPVLWGVPGLLKGNNDEQFS